MRSLIKNIILFGCIILIAGTSAYLLSVRQEGKEINWETVGEGGRETIDNTKEFYDSSKVKVIEVWDEIEEGYDKKDSLK